MTATTHENGTNRSVDGGGGDVAHPQSVDGGDVDDDDVNEDEKQAAKVSRRYEGRVAAGKFMWMFLKTVGTTNKGNVTVLHRLCTLCFMSF